MYGWHHFDDRIDFVTDRHKPEDDCINDLAVDEVVLEEGLHYRVRQQMADAVI